MDGINTGVRNDAMQGRIPRSLTKKRNQLAYEGEQMRAHLAAVVTELAALDHALSVIDPGYKAPRKATASAQRPRTALYSSSSAAPCRTLRSSRW